MNWGDCNFDDLLKLQQQVDAAANNLDSLGAQEFCEQCANELALRLKRLVVEYTPVESGNLKRNWEVSPVRREGNSYVIDVRNNAEYASYVEDGHRICRPKGVQIGYVEPQHFLKRSEEELLPQIQGILDRKVGAWLKSLLAQ